MSECTTFTCDGCGTKTIAQSSHIPPGWSNLDIRGEVVFAGDYCRTCSGKLIGAIETAVKKEPIAIPA